jgi:hypothetical protein
MIRELLLVLLFLAVQTSHADIPGDDVTRIKKARLCQDLLTSASGVPRAFGNFRLDKVSSEYASFDEVFSDRTGRVMYEPGRQAIALYLKGFEFEVAVGQNGAITWVPSRVIGEAMAHQSSNGGPLEKSDILDIKPEFRLNLRWLIALNRARDVLTGLEGTGETDLSVISQFTRKQMEGILFASLSGPTVIEPQFHESELKQRKRILLAAGFFEDQAVKIAEYFIENSYEMYYAAGPFRFTFTEEQMETINSLFWVSSVPSEIPPEPLPVVPRSTGMTETMTSE